MKGAIFCSLAFFAFQIVFAQLPYDVGTASDVRHEEAADKIFDATEKNKRPFWDAVNAMKPKGKATYEIKGFIGNCMTLGEIHSDFETKTRTATVECDKCYDKADKTKNNEVANKCCDEAMSALVKAIKANTAKGVECVKKCDKLGAVGCLKMVRKLAKIYFKNPGYWKQ